MKFILFYTDSRLALIERLVFGQIVSFGQEEAVQCVEYVHCGITFTLERCLDPSSMPSASCLVYSMIDGLLLSISIEFFKENSVRYQQHVFCCRFQFCSNS